VCFYRPSQSQNCEKRSSNEVYRGRCKGVSDCLLRNIERVEGVKYRKEKLPPGDCCVVDNSSAMVTTGGSFATIAKTIESKSGTDQLITAGGNLRVEDEMVKVTGLRSRDTVLSHRDDRDHEICADLHLTPRSSSCAS
jgi:hypothetical protein